MTVLNPGRGVTGEVLGRFVGLAGHVGCSVLRLAKYKVGRGILAAKGPPI